MGVLIVDSHVHLGRSGLAPGTPGSRAAFAEWPGRARLAGIGGAVLMASPPGPYDRDNVAVATVAAWTPGFWWWYVAVHGAADRGRVAAVVEAAHRRGACGIKVHWSDGPATEEVALAAARHRMPVLYDPYGDTDRVAHLAIRHPEVCWIVPHLSSFADDWQAQRRMIALVTTLPNVFTDTAGIRYFDLLAEAVRRAGPDKVLFGTDGPYLHPAPELAKVLALGLPPEDRALVLSGNVARLTRPARALARSHHARTPYV